MTAVNRVFKKQHYSQLRAKLRDRGFPQAASSLSFITGRSESYMSACLAGRKSFQPKDMEKIMIRLNIDKQDAMEYFPPFGIGRQLEVVTIPDSSNVNKALNVLVTEINKCFPEVERQ